MRAAQQMLADKINSELLGPIVFSEWRKPWTYTWIAFIDGWNGKGAATELCWGIKNYNAARQTHIAPDVYVVADLAGTASLAATAEDYLIPSAHFMYQRSVITL